jgi:NAD(P)-dependent dehydrogenase (short-subunit alcohol dehydrogenase family)
MSHGIPDIDGRTAVITGAASGIGRQVALQLSALGANLALVDVDEAGLAKLSAELRTDRRVSQHLADVSNRERMATLAPEVAAEHDQLHILLNNAGIGYEAAFPQTPLDAFDRVLGINLWGVIHGCHFFMPYLAKADWAHIVNMSSLFGFVGMPGQTAYCASKYAVRGFSEALWEELRTTRVGLTVVHPGGVATNVMKASDGDDPELLAHLAGWYEANAYPPAKAAGHIITAIQKGRRRLLITPEAYLADVVTRLMPVWGNKAVGDVFIRVLKLEHMREVRKTQWERTMVDGKPDE